MKTKTNEKSPTKKKGPAKKPEAPLPLLGLDELKAVAVKTGIMAGSTFAYHCAHISD